MTGKHRLLSQSEIVAGELEKILTPEWWADYHAGGQRKKDAGNILTAYFMQMRSDVAIESTRLGIDIGRKEGLNMGIAALEGLRMYEKWGEVGKLPKEVEKRTKLLKEAAAKGDDKEQAL